MSKAISFAVAMAVSAVAAAAFLGTEAASPSERQSKPKYKALLGMAKGWGVQRDIVDTEGNVIKRTACSSTGTAGSFNSHENRLVYRYNASTQQLHFIAFNSNSLMSVVGQTNIAYAPRHLRPATPQKWVAIKASAFFFECQKINEINGELENIRLPYGADTIVASGNERFRNLTHAPKELAPHPPNTRNHKPGFGRSALVPQR